MEPEDWKLKTEKKINLRLSDFYLNGFVNEIWEANSNNTASIA